MSAAELGDRSLYLCTSDRPDLEHFVAECVAGGVDVVQLREKHLDARPLLARASALAQLCRGLGVPFILNDRPDLALECEADGVHVGQDDAPPSLCRRLLGPGAIVGYSTHATSELAGALTEPVDYVSVGPVTPTPTKPGRPGTGLGYVTGAAGLLAGSLPFFVTGGVTPETVPAIAAAGARRFVVVRYLTQSAEPRAAAAALRRAIDEALAAASG